jgi:hypothetical protein
MPSRCPGGYSSELQPDNLAPFVPKSSFCFGLYSTLSLLYTNLGGR